MAKKKSEGVPAPKDKLITCQYLAPGQRADLGVSDANAARGQYAKNPPVNDEDYASIFVNGMSGPY